MPAYAPFDYHRVSSKKPPRKKPLMHSPERKREKLMATFRFLVLAGLVFGGLVTVVGAGYVWTVISDIPDTKTLESLNIAQSTTILDRDGNELYRIHGAENRRYVPITEISKNLQDATIAAEDTNFYHHPGFDVWGLMSAVKQKVLNPDTRLRGASTITQQLVRGIFLSPERTTTRKIKEIIIATQLESRYSKDKILELYLNQISYGSNSYGIETAAQTFLGKSAKDLTIADSAILASLPNGPSYFSPYGENRSRLMGECKKDDETEEEEKLVLVITAPKKTTLQVSRDGKKAENVSLKAGEKRTLEADAKIGFTLAAASTVTVEFKGAPLDIPAEKAFEMTLVTAQEQFAAKRPEQLAAKNKCSSMDDPDYVDGRKDYVLRRMLAEGLITQEQAQQAWEQANATKFQKYRESIRYPHFVFYVKDYLEAKYGQDLVEKGGLRVKTTIDPRLQDMAQEMIAKKVPELQKNYKMSNAALVSANPKTGEIVAMVGSRDYWDEKIDGKVNIATSLRQPGSSFKPLIYAAFVAAGNGAGTVLWDTRTKFGDKEPDNADGSFMGPMPVRKALAWSRNIPAIKAYFLAGQEDVILDYLKNFGVDLLTRRDQARLKNPTYSYGYPLAIGSAELRMTDMVQAYAVLANGGIRKDLTPILEVQDKDGNILEQLDQKPGTQTIDPQVAYVINDVLSDRNARPGGYWRDRITVPGNHVVAVKTGTSNKRINDKLILPSDNWTMGYSRSLVTAMWGGNNDGSALAANAFDVNTLASTWRDYMAKALEGKPSEPFEKPEGITTATVSLVSGLKATENTPANLRVTDIFPSFGVPQEYDGSLKVVKVDTRNNLLANEDCPPAFVKDYYVLTGSLPEKKFGWQESPWTFSGEGNESSILPKAPTETSPLCTPRSDDQKPSLSIVSPLSFGQVTKGQITVAVRAASAAGVERVEYFLDGNPTVTSRGAPYTGIFVVPLNAAVNSVHTIRAVLYDAAGFTAEASVDVTVTDSDTSPPQVSFLSPADGATVPLGSALDVVVDAFDDTSSIRSVDISMNGTAVGSSKRPPYSVSFTPSAKGFSAGPATLTARVVDRFGNQQEASIRVTLVDGGSQPTPTAEGVSSVRITQPAGGATLTANRSHEIRVLSKGGENRSVEVTATNGGQTVTIQKVTGIAEDVDNVVVFWRPKSAGTYSLIATVRLPDGSTVSSESTTVTVQ